MTIDWNCCSHLHPEIRAIHARTLADLQGDGFPLHYGPAHVVWDDYNFDSVQFCLDNFDENATDSPYTPAQLEIVKRSLIELAALPAEVLLDWVLGDDDRD